MNKCIVTGGCGFIGSHVAERLVNDGNQVVILDNLSNGNLKNIEKIKKKIKFVNLVLKKLKDVKNVH